MVEETISIMVLESDLSPQTCEAFVQCPEAGGIVVFIGTVRKYTKNREVIKLAFESYAPMALREMTKIAQTAQEKFGALRVAIHHRVGGLDIGEVPVIIAVACPHRKAAFEACQYAIDTLKETVPIWKKEFFSDGEVWVSAYP